eukprot:6114698-Alexandrium_andersonii.AAC.1
MTETELAGDGFGLELRRLLVREHEAPEEPAVQREFQKAGPARSVARTPPNSGRGYRSGRCGAAGSRSRVAAS